LLEKEKNNDRYLSFYFSLEKKKKKKYNVGKMSIIAKIENRATKKGERTFFVVQKQEKVKLMYGPSFDQERDILAIQTRFVFPAIAVLGGVCGLIGKIAGLY